MCIRDRAPVVHICVRKGSVSLLIIDTMQEDSDSLHERGEAVRLNDRGSDGFLAPPLHRPLSKVGRVRLHTHVCRHGPADVDMQTECVGRAIIQYGNTAVH